MQRIGESKDFYKEVLDKPFDYSVKEDFNTDYEKLPYAKTVAELKEKWRKQIKLSTLSSLTDKLKMQEDLKNGVVNDKNKKDKGLNDKTGKSPATLSEKRQGQDLCRFREETRESSLKSLNEYFDFINDLDQNDWFSVYECHCHKV
jgi:carboxyl-terminal processing protease